VRQSRALPPPPGGDTSAAAAWAVGGSRGRAGWGPPNMGDARKGGGLVESNGLMEVAAL